MPLSDDANTGNHYVTDHDPSCRRPQLRYHFRMKWTEWITLSIAVLGAGLSVWNAWQARRDRSVRFRVHATQAIGVGGPAPTCLSIEVTNLSAFPITIEEIGLTAGKPRGRLPRRAMIPPNSIVSGSLPMRIEPHHSGTVVGWSRELPDHGYDHAYARTSGGEIGFGTSPALIQWIRSLTR